MITALQIAVVIAVILQGAVSDPAGLKGHARLADDENMTAER